MSKLSILLLFILLFTQLKAQDNLNTFEFGNEKTSKIQPYADIHLDIMNGKDYNKAKRTDFRFGATLGVKSFGLLETGLGVDAVILDTYTNLAPHLHLGLTPIDKWISPFIETDLGYSFVMESTFQQQNPNAFDTYETNGSFYYSIGGGLKLVNKTNTSISVSGGYSRFSNTRDFSYTWNDFQEKITDTFSRWYIRFGFGF